MTIDKQNNSLEQVSERLQKVFDALSELMKITAPPYTSEQRARFAAMAVKVRAIADLFDRISQNEQPQDPS